MAHLPGVDRTQAILLPDILDDYVGSDNPVRFLDAFVAQLDLAALGFQRAVPAETGRPGYDPGDLLRLYLYGYLHRIRSSRRLDRNVELLWLLRRLTPDFKTIADFRRDRPEALKRVGREFVLLCRELELFGGELLAIDGSKFRAVNARDRSYTPARLATLQRDIDRTIARYLREVERCQRSCEIPHPVIVSNSPPPPRELGDAGSRVGAGRGDGAEPGAIFGTALARSRSDGDRDGRRAGRAGPGAGRVGRRRRPHVRTRPQDGPRVAGARAYEVVLEPGEAIFMPFAWWHQVRALDFSVTITYTNFRWPNQAHATFPSD